MNREWIEELFVMEPVDEFVLKTLRCHSAMAEKY